MSSFFLKKQIIEYLPIIFSILIVLSGSINSSGIILLLIMSGYIFLKFSSIDKFLKQLLLISLIIRIIFIIFDVNFHLLPYEWDVEKFHLNALRIKDNYINNNYIFYHVDSSLSVRSYSFFMSWFYYLFGDHQILIRFINAFFSTLTIAKVYLICIEIFNDKRTARFASFIVALFPSIIIFTCLNMRDSLVLFLSMAMLHRFILITKSKKKLINLFLFIINLILITLLRNQNLILFSFIFLIYFMYLFSKNFNLSKRSFLAYIIICVIVLSFIFFKHDFSHSILQYSNIEMKWRSTGGAAYLQGITYNNWYDIIKYIPIRLLYFTFGPFIWDVRSIFLILAFFEALLIIFFCYCTIKFFIKSRIKIDLKYKVILISFGIFGLVANAIIDSNYGTAIRHRMNYVIIFFIFASSYLSKYRIKIF
ncbi:MAG: glycosyltransferase family 39 protein [Candidatus Hodarchaeota archaeon]